MWVTCSACDGAGRVGAEDPCLTCGGRGVVFEKCNKKCCPDCNGTEECDDDRCPDCNSLENSVSKSNNEGDAP